MRLSGVSTYRNEYGSRVALQYCSFVTLDQFSYLGNRAQYEFVELDMSTGLDLSILSSRPLTFPGGQSKNGYRARFFTRRKKEKNGS